MAKNFGLLLCLLLLNVHAGFTQRSGAVREELIKVYESQIGIREKTGRNDGADVERYLSYVWLPKGNPWCAAYVSWCLGQVGIKRARSGGCVQLMEQGSTIYRSSKANASVRNPIAGDVFFIYFAEKKRVAHTGFVHQWGETTVTTVEGNTNEAGSREGDGVYRKRRLKRQIYAVTTYDN